MHACDIHLCMYPFACVPNTHLEKLSMGGGGAGTVKVWRSRSWALISASTASCIAFIAAYRSSCVSFHSCAIQHQSRPPRNTNSSPRERWCGQQSGIWSSRSKLRQGRHGRVCLLRTCLSRRHDACAASKASRCCLHSAATASKACCGDAYLEASSCSSMTKKYPCCGCCCC